MFAKNVGGAIALLQFLSTNGVFAHPGGMPRLMGRGGFVELRDLAPLSGGLVKRVVTPDGSCGGTNGYTCDTAVKKCCSQHGWCGDTDDYCLSSNNCQGVFGTCTQVVVTLPPNPVITRCGTQGENAICPTGQCCSEAGYCGTTAVYCISPNCQIGFGTCDSDTTPAGASTSTVPRPKLGNVAYGNDIYDCVNPGEIALTYDDGPYLYTDGMVDTLNSYNAKATFFMTGINSAKGAIDTTPAWRAVIQKMYASGHQLASHTWSHADLDTLTEARRRDEMIKLEMALRNIVGFFPTYMRPPYSRCSAACKATMADLGYHITFFNTDTDDYNNNTPLLIQNAKNNFENKLAPYNSATDSFLVIAHDIHQQTAQNLTTYMLDSLLKKGYKAVTVGKCLGDPEVNWYRSETPPGSTVSPTVTPTVAPTATATPPPGTCPGAPFKVTNWCATAFPMWTTTSGCWDSVTSCYTQGSACWNTAPWPQSAACGDYQTMCHQMEDVCQACVNAAGAAGPCAYKAPTYPASV